MARAERAYHEADYEGGTPCSRGERCSAKILVRQDDGTFRREPQPGPRAFCDRDRSVIRDDLEDLPEGYFRLGAEMEEMRRAGSKVRMPYGPQMLLHEGMEALMREMALSLAGWHARVAAVARLSRMDSAAVLADGGRAVRAAAPVLAAHVDALLALQPAWMTRRLHVPVARGEEPSPWRGIMRRRHGDVADWLPRPGLVQPRRESPGPVPQDVEDLHGADEIVRAGAGFIAVMRPAGGAEAGLDVLSLHSRCQLLLGEVAGRAETLDGVPCRNCEDMALERAEPPSDPRQEAMHSQCASCRHTMTLDEFREWSAWYARWADGLSLACRRCETGRHGECCYPGCACLAEGHRMFLAA